MSTMFERNLNLLLMFPKYIGIVNQLKEAAEKPSEVLYSQEEAQRGADQSIRECLTLHTQETIRSIVITGFEYGFLAEKIIECMPMEKTSILILESDIQQLLIAMHYRDLTSIFTNGQIHVFVESKDRFIPQLATFISRNFYFITHRILFLENPALRISLAEHIDFLRQSFAGARQRHQMNLGNSPEDTLLGNMHNTFNLKHIIGSYPFERLRNRFLKVPAICVAAGPSLEKNMSLLKGLESHALIFACDTIMEKLQQHDIEPHFLASLERGQMVYEYFYKDRTYSDKTILLGLSLLYPAIYEEYAGAKVIVSRAGLSFEEWIRKTIPELAPVNAGHSVANLNFRMAKEMGCDPIILIGQDLAYGDDGHTHVTGTYDKLDATKKIVDHGEKNKIMIKGYYGGTVETKHVWEVFRRWFEDRCSEATGTIINATEGGAYIEGALHLSLAEVIERYCQDEIDLTPLAEVRNYRVDEIEFNEKAKKVYLAYKKQLELNLNITKELEELLSKVRKISRKSAWNKNKSLVVSKFQQLYNQFVGVSTKENNIFNTIQYKLIQLVSKINRKGAIETFEEVQVICTDLTNIVTMTIHYLGKTAEIYEVGLKVLDEYSEVNQYV
jgi:hypothetical protein